MALSPINPTQLTPPRVNLIDERTGAISREWYRFFLSLLTATQTNQEEVTLAPDGISLLATYDAMLATLAQATETQPKGASSDDVAILQTQIQGLELTPAFDLGSVFAAINSISTAPVTKTADFTVGATETWIINNKSGSTCTVTLPAPATNIGRVLYFQNYQAQTLVSASSNVVGIAGGAAAAAILDAVAGNSATLVSDGTNWITTQSIPNNVMLLE